MQFRLVLSVISILLCISSHAQEDFARTFNGFRTTFYKLPVIPAEARLELPVSAIKIHDVRRDTSYLGVMRKNPGGDQFIQLNGGFAHMQDHYSSLITPSGEKGLLHCFIKKLILSDYIRIPEAELNTRTVSARNRIGKSGIILIAEFYEEIENVYFPLYRIDTTISSFDWLQQKGPDYLAKALKASLAKAGTLNWQKIHEQRTRLTGQQVDSFNKVPLLLPTLTESPVKGIYFTFQEFRDNKPRITEYIVKKEKKGDFIYYKNSKGEETPVLDAWGYCDGSIKYYYRENEFFEIHRTGNGYTWYGTKQTKEKFFPIPIILPVPGAIVGGTEGSIHSTKKIKQLCHLDLDTGMIY